MKVVDVLKNLAFNLGFPLVDGVWQWLKDWFLNHIWYADPKR